MQQGYQLNINDKLKAAWSREQRFINTRGLVRSIIWIVSLIITSLIIDILIWKGLGDNNYGLFLTFINVGIVAYVIYNEWWKIFKIEYSRSRF